MQEESALTGLLQGLKSLSDQIEHLKKEVGQMQHAKVEANKQLTFERQATARVSQRLLGVNSELLRTQSAHDSLKMRLEAEESSQRSVFLSLVTAERTSADTALAAQDESRHFTEKMKALLAANMQARSNFRERVLSAVSD